MITNEITAGVPTEAELESLANSLFPDFDAENCAEGIERLAVSGDTSIISDAYGKAEKYISGYSDYERIANELNYGVSDNEVRNSTAQQSGYSPVVLSASQAESYVPEKNKYTAVSSPRANDNIIVGTKTLAQIRNDFPILKETVNGYPLVWQTIRMNIYPSQQLNFCNCFVTY